MGNVALAEFRDKAALAEQLAQTLMVYQVGGSDFQASFKSKLPFLRISAERGPNGDRWQATVTFDPLHLVPGPIRGAIEISTNDPAFPLLRVPVTGEIR
jgi:hypothetical protein